jgi:hypothetical protein
MFHCISAQERTEWLGVYLSDPEPNVASGPFHGLRIRNSIAHVQVLQPRATCDVDLARSRIDSVDNETGYLFMPAVCDGKNTELAWRLEGEFDHFLGFKPEPGF